jgi:hypothetical protein
MAPVGLTLQRWIECYWPYWPAVNPGLNDICAPCLRTKPLYFDEGR